MDCLHEIYIHGSIFVVAVVLSENEMLRVSGSVFPIRSMDLYLVVALVDILAAKKSS